MSEGKWPAALVVDEVERDKVVPPRSELADVETLQSLLRQTNITWECANLKRFHHIGTCRILVLHQGDCFQDSSPNS